jgi:hypothetical protein
MVTAEQRTGSAPMRGSSQAAELAVVVAPAARVGLAELVVQAARVAPAELAELVVQAARVVPAELAERVVQAVQEALAELAERVVQAARVAPAELAELVVQVVRVALAELAAKLELVPVEEGPVQSQAAALVLAREAVERVLVLVVVPPLKTKSATVAHHHGLVAVPRVEDSKAVAETMREPAATAVARAWEAVATAAAEADVVAVE